MMTLMTPETPETGLSGMPWWVRAIAIIGLPSVLILLVLYFILPVLIRQSEATISALPRIEQKIDHHLDITAQETLEEHNHNSRMENWMRQVCRSLARTEQTRQSCDEVR